MKKENYKKLIMMGIAGGMVVSTQAFADEISSNDLQIQETIAAKAKCKGNHGCPGLTSDNKGKNQEVKYYDPEKDGALQKGDQNNKNQKNNSKS